MTATYFQKKIFPQRPTPVLKPPHTLHPPCPITVFYRSFAHYRSFAQMAFPRQPWRADYSNLVHILKYASFIYVESLKPIGFRVDVQWGKKEGNSHVLS